MNSYNDLKTAIQMAFDYHKGQKRQDGLDYIYHPLEVMMQLQNEDYATQVTAILHDIVEDTIITTEEIYKKFGTEVASAIAILTRREEESYEDYINDIKIYGNETAIKVKLADLCHNLATINNIRDIQKRLKLKSRYENALKVLS